MTSPPEINAKLLLVDDLPANLTALEALLAGPGIELLLARSGDDALELLLQHDVALAMLDVQMPDMNGFELAELMRGMERTKSIPIIFVTAGIHDMAGAFRGYEAGAVDFLFKPIDTRILHNKVATFVALHRQRVQLGVHLDALRASEDLRYRILESTSDAIMLVSSDGRLNTLDRNGAGALPWEAPLENLPAVKERWEALWSDADAVERALGSAIAGEVARFQCRGIAGSFAGSEWDVMMSPLRDAHGSIRCAVASARDVTSMVNLHNELRETLQLNETFLIAVGHDLRSPLNNIMMGAELLADGGVDPASGSILRRIRVSAERMRGMIDELYDLARARLGGGIRLTQTAGVDLETITREVVTELDALRGNRSVQLVSQGDLRGTWDGLRLMQVLSNLTGNALKHGTSDEPVRITLDGEQQQFVRVSVENGGEVPVALRDNVFDPFCQGKASSGRREGLGLGLYIARQIVEAHGGSICVEAALGRTKFSVVLPRTEASIPQAAPA